MKVLRIAAALLSILAVDVAARSTPAGRWRAVFVNPDDPHQPKMIAEVLLVLKADGTTLTGTAEMGRWPGLAPIADGNIDGGRFSFAWTGTIPSSAGYPHMTFTGTVDGDRMTLTMIQGDWRLEMKGERLPN